MTFSIDRFPKRIVCLTEETTEMLYLLGEQDRIVGISGFTVRPPEARKTKPKVSAFTSAKIDKILALEPDLVLGFSDLQADIAAELIRQGINVHVFNQRSIDEIFSMIMTLGCLVGRADKAQHWIDQRLNDIAQIKQQVKEELVQPQARRPSIYFEIWDDPMMSAIKWVSELINITGGSDSFAELSAEPLAKNRIIDDGAKVIAQAPDIIIGSWCGKKFRSEKVTSRPGWDQIPAVKHQQLYEIKSSYILQPGPAALTDGLQQLREIINNWHQQKLYNAK